jgi:hypothetical protein
MSDELAAANKIETDINKQAIKEEKALKAAERRIGEQSRRRIGRLSRHRRRIRS